MKKVILAAVAASLVATPALAAPGQGDGRGDRNRVEQNDRRPQAHRPDARRDAPRVAYNQNVRKFDNQRDYRAQRHNWKRGDRFDARRASNYRVINNPRAYRLHDAPRGYRWVQSGHDAVLVGIASGVIAAIMANSIH